MFYSLATWIIPWVIMTVCTGTLVVEGRTDTSSVHMTYFMIEFEGKESQGASRFLAWTGEVESKEVVHAWNRALWEQVRSGWSYLAYETSKCLLIEAIIHTLDIINPQLVHAFHLCELLGTASKRKTYTFVHTSWDN